MSLTETKVELFLESRLITCRESSVDTYRQCLTAFSGWLEDRAIDAAAIDAYLRSLKARKLSVDTQRNVYRMVKTFCRWLVEQDMLDRDPFVGRARVTMPPAKRQRRTVYSETDVVKLLNATDSVKWKLTCKTTWRQ